MEWIGASNACYVAASESLGMILGDPTVFVVDDDASVLRSMQSGAIDFIEKPCEAGVLVDAVRRALERDRELRTRRSETDSISRRVASLTPRENEVLRHIIAGQLNKQIAAKLGTAEKTIKAHRAGVMRCPCVRWPSSLALPNSWAFARRLDYPAPLAFRS